MLLSAVVAVIDREGVGRRGNAATDMNRCGGEETCVDAVVGAVCSEGSEIPHFAVRNTEHGQEVVVQGGEGGLLFFFGEAPAEWGDLHGRGVGGDGGDVPVPEGLDHLAAGAQPGRARRAQVPILSRTSWGWAVYHAIQPV